MMPTMSNSDTERLHNVITPMPTHTLVCSHCGKTVPIFNISNIPTHCSKEKYWQGKQTQARWIEAWIADDTSKYGVISGMDIINEETLALHEYLSPLIIEEFTPITSQGEVH